MNNLQRKQEPTQQIEQILQFATPIMLMASPYLQVPAVPSQE